MIKYIWWFCLVVIGASDLVSALPVTTISGGTKVFNPIPQGTTESISIQNQALANINNIDTSTDDLIQLKRKLEVEKTEAELRRLRNSSSMAPGSSSNNINAENAQTTVTGVAINQDGRKIAWLQFADGGSLVVSIGSKIGKYKVTNIEMTGVTLGYATGKKGQYLHNVNLKRSYIGNYTSKSGVVGHTPGNPGFIPSPVLTSANNSNDMVPPIVSVR